MSEASNNKTIYFQNLDLLRLLAAIMVAVLHSIDGFTGWFGEPGTFNKIHQISPFLHKHFITLLSNLGFGVDLFFLISGFLITYLLIVEKERFGTIALKNFYLRRILRIWPLYYLMIILAPFIVSWMGANSPQYLPNIFLYNNFNTIKTTLWEYPFAHFWSICIEEHFYLIWPILILLIPIKRLHYLFAGVIFISILFRIYVAYTSFDYMVIFLHTLSRMDVLAIGGFLAWVHYNKPIQFSVSRIYSVLVWILLIILLSSGGAHGFSNTFEIAFKKYIYIALVTYLMGSFLFNSSNILAPKKKNILHYLGKVSYGIYIYHNIFLLVVIQKVFIQYGLKSFWLFQFIYLGGTIVLAIISYELFEKWFLKLKQRFELVKTNR